MTDAARLRYLSVCSGIEAATVAWHPLGWEAAAFSEIEAFPRAVLAHHYPTVPLHGDFTTIEGSEYGAIDLLVGGTPCQDFSVAGLRAGIAGERGNLTLEFLRLASRAKPRWIVWENVPGVLSSDGGRALGAFLGGLADLGYGFAYRVFDAQYFGVAQRRARVFVVGYLGDWRRAAAVLFERESLLGNPPPRREAGKGPAPKISARTKGGGGLGTDFDCDGGLIAHSLRADGFDASEDGTGRGTPIVTVLQDVADPVLANVGRTYTQEGTGNFRLTNVVMQPLSFDTTQITSKANYSNPQPGDPCHPLAAGAHPPAIAFSVKDHDADAGPISPTLRAGGHDKSHANGGVMPAVAFTQNSRSEVRQINGDGSIVGALAAEPGAQQQAYVAYSIMPMNSGKDYKARETDVAQPIMAGGPVGGNQGGDFIAQPLAYVAAMQVRRLTPMECERLQGFSDGYTLVPYRGKPAADGPRYKSLGNSFAVPVVRWIGQRIQMVEALCTPASPAKK